MAKFEKVIPEGWFDTQLSSGIKEAQDKLIKRLSDNQENIIWDRLKAIGVYGIDVSARFQKIAREIDENQIERWYYDDGTREGKLLITFFPPEINTVDEHSTIRATIKYI